MRTLLTPFASRLVRRVLAVGCLLAIISAVEACTSAEHVGAGASSAEPASASSSPALTARRAKAAEILRAMDDPSLHAVERGRLASKGLAEGDFGALAAHKKVLGLMPSEDLDPAQCALLVSTDLERTAKAAVEKRCGPMSDLRAALTGAERAKKTKTLAATCHITGPEVEVPYVHPYSLLLSATLLDELAVDPDATDDERRIAKAVAYVCPLVDLARD